MNRKFVSLFIGFTLPLAALLVLLSWLPGGPTASWQPVVSAQGTVITVTTNLDNGSGGDGAIDRNDCDVGDPDPCTLREAIELVNLDHPTGDVLITFADAYTITLSYRGPTNDGQFEPLQNLYRPDVSIDGDLGGDCVPDVVINGANITRSNRSGLRLSGDGGTIGGLVIQNFSDGYGLQIANGDNLTITCNYIGTNLQGRQAAPNRLGVYVNRPAHDNLITRNVVAGNSQNGVQIAAYPGFEDTLIPYSNTVADNWIGTNPWGDDLGNAIKGVLIQHNAYDNLVYNNRIRYNGYFGVHLDGRKDNNTPSDPSDDEFYPPRGNRIVSNTISNNARHCPPFGSREARAGVLNQDTHLAVSNTVPSLVNADYDNLIADNLISDNGNDACTEPVGFGIFSLGASPLISGNVVQGSKQYGIYNQADFNLTYSPLEADDDILAVPIIQGNTVQNNDQDGIRSLDTSPVAPYQLHISNTVQNNDQGDQGADVSQLWYGVIEVLYGDGTLTGTLPITQNADPVITHLSYPSYRYELGHALPVGPPDVPYTSTVWSDNNSDDYFDVSTWQVVPQFVVTGAINVQDYSPQYIDVRLAGSTIVTAAYSYDGWTSTHPVANEFLVPSSVETGPYGRYQVAQVYALVGTGGDDSDDDGVPDEDECPGGPPCDDADDDGIPDYLDPDDDNDGIPSDDECPGGPPCQDSDDDGIPDYLDPDDDGDGIPTEDECPGGPPCQDSDDDGIPDYLDEDDDNDGVPTEDECPGGPPCQDSDDDGIPDYLDDDDDDDGVPTEDECPGGPPCQDSDDDGIPDYLDEDDDDDGIPTEDECPGGPPCQDSDDDGLPDYLDPDDDDDGIPTDVEYDWCVPPGTAPCDADDDGIPDYLDEDSDGDGRPDEDEYGTCNPGDPECVCDFGDPPGCYVDSDDDGVPDWLDPHYYIYVPVFLKEY